MKSKKAELLGEYTLKIIIAVMSIILLIYLLFSLYSSFTDKKNLTQAGGTLNSLIEKMRDAKTQETSLVLLEPKGWKVLSYVKGEIPGSCSGSCICVCEGVGIKDKLYKTNQADKCEIKGVCKNIDEKINEFEFKLRTEVNIKYNKGYEITENKEDK